MQYVGSAQQLQLHVPAAGTRILGDKYMSSPRLASVRDTLLRSPNLTYQSHWLIATLTRPPSSATSIWVELLSPSYFELVVPTDGKYDVTVSVHSYEKAVYVVRVCSILSAGANVLVEAAVPPLTQEKCKEHFDKMKKVFPKGVNDAMFCAGGDGPGACKVSTEKNVLGTELFSLSLVVQN